MASKAYGDLRTTTRAEYKELLNGLRIAGSTGYSPLHIVSCNHQVFTQMSVRAAPYSHALRRLHKQCSEATRKAKVTAGHLTRKHTTR